MTNFKWNGKTIDDPKGRVDLSPSNGSCQEVCCDCGLGHLFKSDATWASWERIEFADLQGIPKDRKFKIRDELESMKKENAVLWKTMEDQEEVIGNFNVAQIRLESENASLKSKLELSTIDCDKRMERNIQRQESLETEIERLNSKLAEAVQALEIVLSKISSPGASRIIENNIGELGAYLNCDEWKKVKQSLQTLREEKEIKP